MSRGALILLIICCGSLTRLIGQPGSISTVQAEVLLKLLSQNQTFREEDPDTVRVAIVSAAGSDTLRSQAGAALRQISARALSGRALEVRVVTAGTDSLSADPRMHGVIVLNAPEQGLEKILARCNSDRSVSMTTDSALVRRGVSIAVTLNDRQQPEISFNLAALGRAGAVYRQEILQLVKHQSWE